jgi:hypothetical protein
MDGVRNKYQKHISTHPFCVLLWFTNLDALAPYLPQVDIALIPACGKIIKVK